MFQLNTYKMFCCAFAAIATVVMCGYSYGIAACTQDCQSINEWCQHDSTAGVCAADTCVRAYSGLTGTARETTCEACGEDGDSGETNGWCIDGQEETTCEDDPEEDKVWIKLFENCNSDCPQSPALEVVAASDLSDPLELPRAQKPRKLCATVHQ